MGEERDATAVRWLVEFCFGQGDEQTSVAIGVGLICWMAHLKRYSWRTKPALIVISATCDRPWVGLAAEQLEVQSCERSSMGIQVFYPSSATFPILAKYLFGYRPEEDRVITRYGNALPRKDKAASIYCVRYKVRLRINRR